MLALALGLRDPESERAQGVVVAPDLPEAFGKHAEKLRRSEPGPDPSQLDQRLLHLREARLTIPRFDARKASRNPPHCQVQRKPKLLGETHGFLVAFPHPVELTALAMDTSAIEESVRQTERMFHALRQRHRLLAYDQRPVGMAKVHVTPGRTPVGTGAAVVSHRVRQRPVLDWIV